MHGILVGIDGSNHSGRALEWAAREAAVRQLPLTVMTVSGVSTSHWGTAVAYPESHAMAVRAQLAAEAETDKVLAGLGDDRPGSVTVQAITGDPAQELLRSAHDADLLVVGSHGGGGFARLVMGSVSTKVTQHATCPVVVIPSPDRE